MGKEGIGPSTYSLSENRSATEPLAQIFKKLGYIANLRFAIRDLPRLDVDSRRARSNQLSYAPKNIKTEENFTKLPLLLQPQPFKHL